MSTVLTNNNYYTDIANAIRKRKGTDTLYFPCEMAEAINSIDGELPSLQMPVIYASLFNNCYGKYYDGDFSDVMVMCWEGNTDSVVAIVFLMDDFDVLSFNPVTSEFTAQGWFSCYYTESTGKWAVSDYRYSASTGGNYIRNIIWSSKYITYNGENLFPVSITNMSEVSEIIWDDENCTANIYFTNGVVVPMTWTQDGDGFATSVTIDGHTIHVEDLSA